MRSMSNMVLVGDIGGTNARFAIIESGSVTLKYVSYLSCSDFPNLDAAIEFFIKSHDLEFSSLSGACLAFAGPVLGDRINVTNNHWEFSREETRQKFDFEFFKIINDFTAMALGVTQLQSNELIKVGGGVAEEGKPCLIIGPGTGLGMSALISGQSGSLIPIETEGGHVSFAPTDEEEIAILQCLLKRHTRVSVERLLCGQGLVSLFYAMSQVHGWGCEEVPSPHVITERLKDGDEYAKKVIAKFCKILGATAGDAALSIGAHGGVFICGGIVPRIVDDFVNSEFRSAFEDKGRMSVYNERMPTWAVVAEMPGLQGAAVAAANKEVI